MGYRLSFILGLLGLIPFVLLIAAIFITPPDDAIYELLIFIYISYAAVISSFLGGIQWGLITASVERVYSVFLPLFFCLHGTHYFGFYSPNKGGTTGVGFLLAFYRIRFACQDFPSSSTCLDLPRLA